MGCCAVGETYVFRWLTAEKHSGPSCGNYQDVVLNGVAPFKQNSAALNPNHSRVHELKDKGWQKNAKRSTDNVWGVGGVWNELLPSVCVVHRCAYGCRLILEHSSPLDHCNFSLSAESKSCLSKTVNLMMLSFLQTDVPPTPPPTMTTREDIQL